MRSLYFQKKFVSLHQKNPGYNVGNNAGNPKLNIEGINTYIYKYDIVPGFGDPGENRDYDNYDFVEWSIDGATFQRPEDFYTATDTYTAEGLYGDKSVAYRTWGVIQVPDDFIIPANLLRLDLQIEPIIKALLNDIQNLIILKMKNIGVPLVDIADAVRGAYELYKTLAVHAASQMKLVDRAIKGEIDIATLDAESTVLQKDFAIDLANNAGVHSTIAELTKQIVIQRVIYADGSSKIKEGTGLGRFSDDPVGIAHYIIGSSNSDNINQTGAESVILAGDGNDLVHIYRFSGVAYGGSGKDEISFGGIRESGVFINLKSGNATSFIEDKSNSNEYTKIGDFEIYSGTAQQDILFGLERNDVFKGQDGNDHLIGGAGNDRLDGGIGSDYLSGDDGVDTAIYTKVTAYDFKAGIAYGINASLYDPTINTGEALGDEYRSIENLSGTEGNDFLEGNFYTNKLSGNGGNDYLVGLLGDDTLEGGSGKDIMVGGLGNDIYGVDVGSDAVHEARDEGYDQVFVQNHYALMAGQEIESLRLLGSTGSKKFNLAGNEFGQTIIGNAGSNSIEGKGGNDVLTGGRGVDTFVFATKLSNSNVDRITDFAPADDTIRLSKAIFTELATGQLKANEFKDIAKSGRDADDHILYDSRNGKLFYDVDGSSSKAAVQFAVLDNKAAITHADFLIG